MKEEQEKPVCDLITKPTMPPPGGSSQGYWDCDISTLTWVWIDSIAE